MRKNSIKKIMTAAIAMMLVFALFAGCDAQGEEQGSYADLMIMEGVELSVEEYAVGFRVGSDIVPEVNKIIGEMIEDGTLGTIAEKYGMTDSLLSNQDGYAGGGAVSDRITAGDLDYIKSAGTVKVGITIFDPMNYYDADGKLIGFDTEFAEAVFAKLGVTPEFIEINWDTKEVELAAKNIDCIWNGLTITDERRENMEFTDSYIKNMQVVVIRKADAETFNSIESLAGANLCAETGSAGETAIKDDAILAASPYTAMAKQTDTLMEVKTGTSDAAVLDYTLAKANVGS